MGNQEKINKYCNLLMHIAEHDYETYIDPKIEDVISIIVNDNLDYLLTSGFIESMTCLYPPIKWRQVLMGLLDDYTRIILYKESFNYLICSADNYIYQCKYEKNVYDEYCKYLHNTFKERMTLSDLDIEFASEILDIIATYILVNRKDVTCFNDYANKVYYDLDNLGDSMKLQGIDFNNLVSGVSFLDTDEEFQESYRHFIIYIINKLEEDKKVEIR